jgi:hypothetical protein
MTGDFFKSSKHFNFHLSTKNRCFSVFHHLNALARVRVKYPSAAVIVEDNLPFLNAKIHSKSEINYFARSQCKHNLQLIRTLNFV